MSHRRHILFAGVLGAGLLLSSLACHAQRLVSPPSWPYDLEILIDGRPEQVHYRHSRAYVLGHTGERYEIRVTNRSGRRVEAVVTVDGRDVIDGRRGDYKNKRGYLIEPHDSVTIDGWRISGAEVAAFRFSSVKDSYAARMGDARNVGVIGVAIFPERDRPVYRPPPRRWPPPPPRPFREPWGESSRDGDDDHFSDRLAEAEEAPAASPPADALGSGRSSEKAGAKSRSASRYAPSRRERRGLGTAYGERRRSRVHEVDFRRRNPNRPAKIMALQYNDRDGLLALGIDPDPPSWRRDDDDDHWRRWFAEPFPRQPRRYSKPPPGW